MRLRAIIVLGAACCALGLGGCGGEELSGPPDIRLGRDECVHCGMSIVEDRFSCAMLVLEQGRPEHALFDDIGDMLDHERAHPELVVEKRFVHDFNTRAWHEAQGCTFTYAESVHTPMGSGLAAFADEASARAQAEKAGGRVLTYEQLVAFRIAWRIERYGK
ncbi:MAG TPA: nitrous oxide reductase accessory protein NosL [Phycisphaerales bacterium]|nr:nitrous oxide reductase accessory protein NosL [Phycisphaerales bacterium]